MTQSSPAGISRRATTNGFDSSAKSSGGSTSSRLLQELETLKKKLHQVELNSIQIQAHMEKRLKEALAEMQQQPSGSLANGPYVKVSTALKSLSAAVVLLYCQKTISSGAVSKLGYTKAMRHIHLVMGAAIFGMLGSVHMAKRSEGLEKKGWMEIHKKTGVAMLGALVLRVILRLQSPIPERFPGPKVVKHSETLSHYLFYPALLASAISGLVYTYCSGSSVPFLGIAKKDIVEDDMETAQKAIDIHRMLGRLFEYGWLPFHFLTLGRHSKNGLSVVKRITPFP